MFSHKLIFDLAAMKDAQEILFDYIKDDHVENILIAEDHLHHSPKEILIELITTLSKAKDNKLRSIVLVLEHLSYDHNVLLKEAIKKKEFTPELRKIFDKFPFFDAKNLELNLYSELAKVAIENGILIVGAETKGSSAIRKGELQRIKEGNESFEKTFTNTSLKDSNSVKIFLGGAAHIADLESYDTVTNEKITIKGLKSFLNDDEERGLTKSIYIKDRASLPEEDPKAVKLGKYIGKNFDEVIETTPKNNIISTAPKPNLEVDEFENRFRNFFR
ncbi:hypothetical protein [Legionella clemsonensis]|uniref:Uncharacterized protein n=1 Tax=Legionella clemsonensis TaxID=1867846 RepID=A0A222P323_9GAMM|nr:hypothetical protein [Legionella clemsonensis]ASQ46175.1 hypothetical protein clem_08115 [Legionella clemsonensis]